MADPRSSVLLEAVSSSQRDVINRLAASFRQAGESLYLVGGIVRDALLERPLPNDLDFATSAAPARTHELGRGAGAASAYLVGERFGTIGLVFPGTVEPITVEITTFRQDTYLDETRFPSVQLGGSVEYDLARRDFTINAIALDPATGEIIDPWFGRADLAQATIRAVGDPDARFIEDPLRLLRAARFVAQLGFRLDLDTQRAMARQAGTLRRISRERIYAELSKLLVGPYTRPALDALAQTELLTSAMPQLADLAAEAGSSRLPSRAREKELWPHTLTVVSQSPARPMVRWAALLHDAAKPRTRRLGPDGEVTFLGHERAGAELAATLLRGLHADRATIAAVTRLVELHGRPATYDDSWSDSAVRRLALDAGSEWDDLLDLAAADVSSGRADRRQLAAQRIERLRAHRNRLESEAALDQLRSPLDGDDLMRLFGRAPGRWIKEIKERLRDLVIDGELAPDDRERAAALAKAMLDESEQR